MTAMAFIDELSRLLALAMAFIAELSRLLALAMDAEFIATSRLDRLSLCVTRV